MLVRKGEWRRFFLVVILPTILVSAALLTGIVAASCIFTGECP